jgi:hypothetical protein
MDMREVRRIDAGYLLSLLERVNLIRVVGLLAATRMCRSEGLCFENL